MKTEMQVERKSQSMEDYYFIEGVNAQKQLRSLDWEKSKNAMLTGLFSIGAFVGAIGLCNGLASISENMLIPGFITTAVSLSLLFGGYNFANDCYNKTLIASRGCEELTSLVWGKIERNKRVDFDADMGKGR